MIQAGISQRGIYLVDSCEISEEALGVTEQRLTVRTNHQVTDVPLGAKRIKQQFLPVGQTKRRQHHKVVLIAHQEGGDGQRLRGLVCTCWKERETQQVRCQLLSALTALRWPTGCQVTNRGCPLWSGICFY